MAEPQLLARLARGRHSTLIARLEWIGFVRPTGFVVSRRRSCVRVRFFHAIRRGAGRCDVCVAEHTTRGGRTQYRPVGAMVLRCPLSRPSTTGADGTLGF